MALATITEELIKVQDDANTPDWAKALIQCVAKLMDHIADNKQLCERVSKLEDETNELRRELESVREQADRNEQKSRTACLLLHGVEEAPVEDTDQLAIETISKEVGVALTEWDVSRSHRVGPKKSGPATRKSKPRPIIIRFTTMNKRQEVFSNKKNLKGKKFVITESLTAYRLDLLQKMKDKYGVKNTWTSEGRLFAKNKDNGILVISSVKDIK